MARIYIYFKNGKMNSEPCCGLWFGELRAISLMQEKKSIDHIIIKDFETGEQTTVNR